MKEYVVPELKVLGELTELTNVAHGQGNGQGNGHGHDQHGQGLGHGKGLGPGHEMWCS